MMKILCLALLFCFQGMGLAQVEDMTTAERIALTEGRVAKPNPRPSPKVDWDALWRPSRKAKMFRSGQTTTLYTPAGETWNIAYLVSDRWYFIFSIKTCIHGRLMLSSVPRTETDFSMIIELSRHDNKKTQIREPFDLDPLVEVDTPDLLHCNEFRTFWIKWEWDLLQLGRGPILGEQKIIEYFAMNLQDKMNAISLGSGNYESALWQIKENSGKELRLDTPYDFRYETMWKDVSQIVYFPFKVRARSDVHILLSPIAGVPGADEVYEIVIQGWDGTRSVIRTQSWGAEEYVKVESDRMDILKENYHVDMWVSWRHGIIEVGTGPLYNSEPYMRWNNPNPIQVRYLSISTGYHQGKGSWRFNDDLEPINYIKTPKVEIGTYNETYFHIPSRSFFEFGLRVCDSAQIMLAQRDQNGGLGGYEVHLGYMNTPGGVQNTGIRNYNSGGYLATEETIDVLRCDDTKHFWISWHNGTLKVGKGEVYDNYPLVQYKYDPTTFRPFVLGIATYTMDGHWEVRENNGEMLEMEANSVFTNYNQIWRSVNTQDSIIFRVKACKDAHVSLSHTIGLDAFELFLDIIIGGWDNTRSGIYLRDYIGGGLKPIGEAEKETRNLLHCDEWREFWISWSDNSIRVGRGRRVGVEQIVFLDGYLQFPVRSVSFSNGWGAHGTWEIQQDIGDMFVAHTTDTKEYKQWLALDDAWGWTTFDVRACSDVHILLGDIEVPPNGQVDDSQANMYEILIGGWNNTKSVLRPAIGPGNDMDTSEVEGILSCRDTRSFWVAWIGKFIQVGVGNMYGANTPFLSWEHPNRYVVLSLSYTTGWGHTGDWYWRENIAAFTVFNSLPEDNTNQLWRVVEHRQSLVFTVQACRDVKIGLSSRIGFLEVYGYILRIGAITGKSYFYNGFGSTVHVERDTVGILACDQLRSFWISWNEGSISFGKGEQVGDDIVLNFQQLVQREIKAISFSTSAFIHGTFILKLLDALIEQPPLPTFIPRPTENSPGGGMSGGEIAGIVIGVLIVAALVAGVLFYTIRNDMIPNPLSRAQPSQQEHPSSFAPPTMPTPEVEEKSGDGSNA